jgi:hypothetical protein
MNAHLAEAIERRQRAEALATLRRLATREPAPPAQQADGEHCDLCGRGVPDDHRHMLDIEERRIVCSCETCWGLHSGDAAFRPVGSRTLWLPDLDMPEEVWASFQVPIGLAFFMFSSVTQCVIALYPSPAGATESELHFSTWQALVERNAVLAELEPDCEALIVNRMSDPPRYAIAPIDRCYGLVGLVKVTWEGISGGPGVAVAVDRFFDELQVAA